MLCYSKYKKSGVYKFKLDSQGVREYKFMGKKGLCRIKDILDSDVGTKKRDTMKFEILGVTPPEGQRWKIGRDEVNQLIAKNSIEIVDGKIKVAVYPDDEPSEILKPFWSHFEDCGTAETGKNTLNEVLNKKVGFDTVKPVDLISNLILHSTATDSEDIVLDFFAGSGTTAHAVMELNAEDGGTRQCISVQMPEVLAEDSEAYKAGYRTIADITRARIDKVIAKLKAEQPLTTQGLACAHFTLAPSNFKVWRSNVNDAATLRDQLALFQSAEKNRPAPQAADAQTAMLAELLLKNGLGALGVHAISKPKQIAGVTVHRVLLEDNRTLWLCFEPYTQALKDEMVKAQPAQVILLNSCFVGDQADELLANLQLELAGLEIGLTVI
ncbi:DNA methyltransferase [Giesbergeria sp.]|uniref:DNA methyltransferase n=1 Tax=Giesbergeria sp. TaxID=2818473 RepID=UPI003426893C